MNAKVANQRLVKFPQLEGATEVTDTTGTVVFYLMERNGHPVAMGFVGRRIKPDFRYRFKTPDEAKKYAENWLQKRQADAEADAEKKAFQHSLKVGDVLVSSWGYEQTNVNFYEVVALKGKKTVVLQERNTSVTGDGAHSMAGFSVPASGFLHDERLTRRVGEGNTVKIESYARAVPWNGKKERTSWYA